jgi:hypothetical protein
LSLESNVVRPSFDPTLASPLFAGVAVADFQEARAWYERFFGRAPNVVAHDEE